MTTVTLSGMLYDGCSSKPLSAQLSCTSDGQTYLNQHPEPLGSFATFKVSNRIGNSARYLILPNGSQFETRENDTVDQLCKQWHTKKQGLPHRLENNLKLVGLSMISLVGIAYLAVVFGIPLLSKHITHMLPDNIDSHLAGHSLSQLDQMLFNPSELDAQRQAALTALFNNLLPDNERQYRLLFRHGGKAGANAFALPDGTIIVTDQLVRLSEDDNMLASVLLHEIGHVKYRHTLQNLVRQASLSALIVAITGDVNAASSLVLMLPGWLIQSQYSREFEWQADTYALEQMTARQMDTNSFALMMEKMTQSAQQKHKTKSGEKEQTAGKEHNQEDMQNNLMDYFSTHPASRKRIERFRHASKAGQ